MIFIRSHYKIKNTARVMPKTSPPTPLSWQCQWGRLWLAVTWDMLRDSWPRPSQWPPPLLGCMDCRVSPSHSLHEALQASSQAWGLHCERHWGLWSPFGSGLDSLTEWDRSTTLIQKGAPPRYSMLSSPKAPFRAPHSKEQISSILILIR